MDTQALVRQWVQEYFVTGKYNCAMTVLSVLAEAFDITLEAQTVEAAWCMPGAGGVDGLCGLVSGGLMFLGIWGAQYNVSRQALSPIATGFSQGVQRQFGSIQCGALQRDGGCAPLAIELLDFALPYFETQLQTLV